MIGAVYRQAENDYEELWTRGIRGAISKSDYREMKKRKPLMNWEEYVKIKTERYKIELKELESFMGDVYTMYAKVRAIWRYQTHDPKIIADKIGIEPEHVVTIIERLGLNRTETAQNETEIY